MRKDLPPYVIANILLFLQRVGYDKRENNGLNRKREHIIVNKDSSGLRDIDILQRRML